MPDAEQKYEGLGTWACCEYLLEMFIFLMLRKKSLVLFI